eukprot:58203_1
MDHIICISLYLIRSYQITKLPNHHGSYHLYITASYQKLPNHQVTKSPWIISLVYHCILSEVTKSPSYQITKHQITCISATCPPTQVTKSPTHQHSIDCPTSHTHSTYE